MRLGRLMMSGSAPKASARNRLASTLASPSGRPALCVVAGGLAGWSLDGPTGAVLGALSGLATSWWVGRLEPPETTRAREEMARDLPLAVDLLAACATAGQPTDRSLAVVSRAVGGAFGTRLDGLQARLSLGADPLSAWQPLAGDEQLAPLARTMIRALESGAPMAASLTRLADDSRRRRYTVTQLRARSVGVKAAGPLALCFLPAFMVIGVVPTVVGAFSHLVL
jgi:Flp pilus assembly protein TadB